MMGGPITVPAGVPVPGGGGGGSGSTITLGAYASAPGSPASGDMHMSNDGPIFRHYNGASWDDLIPGVGPITVPPTGGWSFKNSGTASWSVDGGGLLAQDETPSAGGSVYAYRSATAPWTITIFVQSVDEDSAHGVAFFESATNKGISAFFNQANQDLVVQRDTDLGVTFASTAFNDQISIGAILLPGGWWQLEDDNATIYFRWSPDGRNWRTVYSEARGAFFTTAPDSFAVRIPDEGVVRVWSYVEI